MDGSGASIGVGKGKLAVVKGSSSEQILVFTFKSLWNSQSWHQYLAFSDRFLTCFTYLDVAAVFQGHVLLLLLWTYWNSCLNNQGFFVQKCNDV